MCIKMVQELFQGVIEDKIFLLFFRDSMHSGYGFAFSPSSIIGIVEWEVKVRIHPCLWYLSIILVDFCVQ
jgi:hypothetical protein